MVWAVGLGGTVVHHQRHSPFRGGGKVQLRELVRAVRQAGVVGAGGAGFPTHRKLKGGIATVIVNAAECEPLLQVDQVLLDQFLDVVLEGIWVVFSAVKAKKAYIAIKAKHHRLNRRIQEAAASQPWLELAALPDIYPMGDEHVLCRHILGRSVPPGGIPLDLGAVVLNVETLYNVAMACEGRPVTHSWVTVAGAVREPVTVRVPIGMAVEQVVAAAKPIGSDWRVIEGGPMMGKVVQRLDQPVTKTTKGLIVVPEGHRLLEFHGAVADNWVLKRADQVCCSCTACTDLCPRHLLGHPLAPHRIMRALLGGINLDSTVLQTAVLCSECGVCDGFACPMGLSPRAVNRLIKFQLSKAGRAKPSFQLTAADDWGLDSQVPVDRLMYRLNLMEWNRPVSTLHDIGTPSEVSIPLRQHVGVPAKPKAKVGTRVAEGEMVAACPSNQLGANVHTGVSGTVTSITDWAVTITASGGDSDGGI